MKNLGGFTAALIICVITMIIMHVLESYVFSFKIPGFYYGWIGGCTFTYFRITFKEEL